MALYTRQQVIDTLRPLGYTGDATGGTADEFISSNPNAKAAMQNLYSTSTAPASYSAGGVTPITLEPRHQFEKEALTQIGTGNIRQVDPRSQEYLDRFGESQSGASEMLTKSAQGFNQADFDSVFNPYTEQVTNRTMDRLSDRAKEMKAQLERQLASNRGNATFGDLYGAQHMGDIERETVQTSGDILAKGNESAFNTALEAMFRQRGLQSTAGQAMGNVGQGYLQGANTSSGIISNELAQGLTGLNAQYGAGENIRSYNQNAANMAFENQMAPLMASNAATSTAVQQFPNVQGAQAQYTATPINRFGQIAEGASSAIDNLRGIKF